MTTFEANIINIYAEQGKAWLADIPKKVNEIAVKWGLSDLQPMNNLSYNYVLSGFQNAQPIILKLGINVKELNAEAVALKSFGGFGAVKILIQREGALLLERAIPGDLLKSYFPNRDHDAIQITCEVMKKLHQAPLTSSHTYPHVRDWLTALDKNWDIPAGYLEKARHLRDQLLITAPTEVLLHGDLHHENILRQGEQFVIIDPKGVIGEPAYEIPAFIRNPIPKLLDNDQASKIISTRISDFSDILGIDRKRIEDWCFVQAVLSWLWSLEEGTDPSYFNRLTIILDETQAV